MAKLPIINKTAYLIKDRLVRKYLTGVDVAEGFLVVGEGYVFFTDARYFSAVKELLCDTGIEAALYTDLNCIKERLKKEGIKRLLIDYDTTTLTEFNQYKALGVKLGDCSKILKDCRIIKSCDEIELVEKACQITENAVWNSVNKITAGVTENYIKDCIESEMKGLGADGVAFESIVAFGKNSAVPHHETGNTVLVNNSAVLIDVGAKYKGYCADVTRTFFFGEPDKKFLECYGAVLDANVTAIEKITHGTSLKEADAVARNLLKERGIGDRFTHSLGHGVGIEIHEEPRLSPKAEGKTENGMVFTIEPGVYFDGEFGIRIEDTVYLKDGRVKRLYGDSKELYVIK